MDWSVESSVPEHVVAASLRNGCGGGRMTPRTEMLARASLSWQLLWRDLGWRPVDCCHCRWVGSTEVTSWHLLHSATSAVSWRAKEAPAWRKSASRIGMG